MKQELTILSAEELKNIHGGDGFSTGVHWLDATIFVIGLGHVFIGLREFVNYSVDVYQGNIEENDHFTNLFIWTN